MNIIQKDGCTLEDQCVSTGHKGEGIGEQNVAVVSIQGTLQPIDEEILKFHQELFEIKRELKDMRTNLGLCSQYVTSKEKFMY